MRRKQKKGNILCVAVCWIVVLYTVSNCCSQVARVKQSADFKYVYAAYIHWTPILRNIS